MNPKDIYFTHEDGKPRFKNLSKQHPDSYINGSGKFILLVLSTALINGSYDKVIEYADMNFLAYDNCLAFQGSLLRLKALAIQLQYAAYERGDYEEAGEKDLTDKVELATKMRKSLKQAVFALLQAQDLFADASDPEEGDPNLSYGMNQAMF